MKLLYVANIRFPSERAQSAQIAHMCEAFTATGTDVELVVNNRINRLNYDVVTSVDGYFGFLPHFKVTKIRFGMVFIPTSKTFFLLNNFFFTMLIVFKYNFKKVDFVYVRDEWIGFFISFFIPIQKIVYESHQAKYNLAVRYLLNKGVKCICISKGIYDVYREKNISKEKLIVAHDGVDASFFMVDAEKGKMRKKMNIPEYENVAMYIGGFAYWKGIDTFCEASNLKSQVLFVVIGGSKELIEKYGYKYPKVKFLGSLPYRDLKYNQQAADILIIPNTKQNNLSAHYTSPLKLFAHMASGVPILASDIPSLRNVLADKGDYFDADDSHSLNIAIENLLVNFTERKKRAIELRSYSKKFLWNKRAEHIIDFIKL